MCLICFVENLEPIIVPVCSPEITQPPDLTDQWIELICFAAPREVRFPEEDKQMLESFIQ